MLQEKYVNVAKILCKCDKKNRAVTLEQYVKMRKEKICKHDEYVTVCKFYKKSM